MVAESTRIGSRGPEKRGLRAKYTREIARKTAEIGPEIRETSDQLILRPTTGVVWGPTYGILVGIDQCHELVEIAIRK